MDDITLLTKILKKYLGIRMYKKEQDEFKEEFFYALFEPYEKVDYTNRSTLFINTVLEEDNLPYFFSSDEEKENLDHINEGYWELIDLNKK
jgi:hypothetical protein